MVKKLTEKQIESQILRWLNLQPEIFAFKVNTMGVYDTKRKLFRRNKNPYVIKGTSDIIGLWKGTFFALEVKTKKGKLTEDQRNFLLKVIEKGGVADKVSSVEDACIFIQNLRLGLPIASLGGIPFQPRQIPACLRPPLIQKVKKPPSKTQLKERSLSKVPKVDS